MADIADNVNRDIFNENYTPGHVELKSRYGYDARTHRIRFSYIEKYGRDADVLDICCGTGSYLVPSLPIMRSAVGMDFSRNMLEGLKARLGESRPDNVSLVEADARQLPFRNCSFDFAFSYTSMYAIPNLAETLLEVARVLRPGGHAVLELGNSRSLNSRVVDHWYRHAGWAKLFAPPYPVLFINLENAGLEIVEHRSFQIIPMYGATRGLLYMLPLLSERWKLIMGVEIGGRMLDEIVSSMPLLRRFSFRHLFVVRKK